jgi:hypothetical protein
VFLREIATYSGYMENFLGHNEQMATRAANRSRKSMKTIFDACTPRKEVLKGELKEQQFAASLTKVLRKTAETVYGDPL